MEGGHALPGYQPLPTPSGSVRLLPNFDTLLLSHARREHLVSTENHALVYRQAGWVSAVVLSEGAIADLASRWRNGEGGRVPTPDRYGAEGSCARGGAPWPLPRRQPEGGLRRASSPTPSQAAQSGSTAPVQPRYW